MAVSALEPKKTRAGAAWRTAWEGQGQGDCSGEADGGEPLTRWGREHRPGRWWRRGMELPSDRMRGRGVGWEDRRPTPGLGLNTRVEVVPAEMGKNEGRGREVRRHLGAQGGSHPFS